MKYSNEEYANDLKRVISVFKKAKFDGFAKLKEQELEEFLKKWKKEMIKIKYENVNNHIDYVLEDETELYKEDWNSEIYKNGLKDDKNTNLKYKPVFNYQIENIDLTKLEENSDEWLDAVKIVGFEVL